ncbi:MAG: hypothetical protein M3R24_24735 [Chloroflexota bacterium]|nr:hypothetical protein [Chloroflexota bacterium]
MSKLKLHTPTYDDALYKLINEVNRGLLSLDPILGAMPLRPTIHGGTIRNVRSPKIVDHSMEAHQYTISIDFDVIRNTDVEKLTIILYEFAEESKRRIIPAILSGISEVTDAVGNTIDAQGRPFSFDLLNEMLEKIHLEFDEQGNPLLPTMMVNPNTYEKIKDVTPTPEQAQRFREIITAKKEEHDAKKRTRRLS